MKPLPKTTQPSQKIKFGPITLNPYQKANSSFFGIIIFSGAVSNVRKLLFEKDRQKEGIFCIMPSINRSPYMASRHFEDIKT